MKSNVQQLFIPVLNPSLDPISFQRGVYQDVDVQYYTTSDFDGSVHHTGFLLLVVEFVHPFNRQRERLTEVIPDTETHIEEKVHELVLPYFDYINPNKELSNDTEEGRGV